MSIKNLRVLTLYIAASLTLAACDNGTNNSTPISVSSPEPEEITSVSGQAAKGLILGGIVDIYPIINGMRSDTSIASGTTDADNGSYSIQIADYDGSPFVVRVSAADDSSTTMRCDLASGCGGGVVFGGIATLDNPDFKIDAVVPPITEDSTTSVNLSVLTDTATSVALEVLSSNSNTTLEEAIAAISNANSSIANRFGVQGDITTLPIVDLTDPAAVDAASNNALTFNLLSAAIVEAMINGDSTLTITDSMNGFAEQFVNNGGLADTESSPDASVTLAEILAQASAVIDAIQAADIEGLTNLATLESIIETNQNLAENGSTEPDSGTPTDPTLDELNKAKAMVQSLRTLQAATFTDAEAFVEQVELASNSLDNHTGDVMQALIYAAEAIGSASGAYGNDDTLTSFIDSDTDITVDITATDTDTTYSVDTTVDVGSTSVTVAITAIDRNSSAFLDETDGTPGNTSTTFTVGLDTQGTISSDYAELNIESGKITVMASIIEETLTDIDTETVDANITDITLDLLVSLSEVSSAVVDPVTFTGNILLAIDNVAVDSSRTGNYVMGEPGPVNILETWDETITFDEIKFALGGSFEAPSGASLSANVLVSVDGTDFSYNCVNNDSTSNNEICDGDSDLVDITLNVATTINVPEVSTEENVSLMVIQSRIDAENDDPMILITYGATQLTIMLSDEENANGTSESTIVVTNQNNVTMTMTQTETDSESSVSGNITVNDMEQATISDDQGTVIITYSDGFNESF